MTAMPLRIRVARTDDLPALDQLMRKSVRGLSAGYYSPRQIELSLIHVFGIDTQLIADETYFVAEIDGRIAGCGGWSKRRTLYGGDQTKMNEDSLLNPLAERSPATAHTFVVDPLHGKRRTASASHPPTERRIARLHRQAAEMEGVE